MKKALKQATNKRNVMTIHAPGASADHPRGRQRISLTPPGVEHFGIGAFKRDNILIVGEQPARAHLGINTPFSEAKGCSGWLNNLLDKANIDERDLFWCNALNNDNSKLDIVTLVARMKPYRIMTLGGVAHKLLEHHGIDHEKFYHPSYWKRFHSKDPYPFIPRLIWVLGQREGRNMV
jgi:hypothetical protein